MGRRGFAGQSVRFETLEPRTMFSADVVALVAPEPLVEQAVVTGTLAEPAPVRIDMQGAAPATARSEAAAQRRELVVVDASIADYLALVDDVLGNDAADVARQILVLDSTRDGLTQIAAALTASRAPYDALHLIGHANATGMQLGAVWLTAGDIARHADELADWRSALSDDADILLYGCDLAQAAQGQRLVQALAAATGADIAASTDLTGQPVLGGDWVLEYRVGSIQSDLAVGAPLQSAWSGTLLANQTTSNQQSDAAVAADAAGNFVVVWQSHSQDGGGWGVYARRYDAAGTPLGNEFRVTGTTNGDQFEPDVAMDAAGNFVVVWTTQGQNGDADTEGNIYARAFDADGNAVSSEFRVNATKTGDQASPSVAFEAQTGTYMVAWASQNQDGSGWGVYARKFDLPHNALTAEFLVNTTTTGDQRAPDVAGDAFGNFAFAWQSDAQDGDGWGIYRRYYQADDTFFGGELGINATTAGDQTAPVIAFDAAGDYLVSWTSAAQDGNGAGIYAAFFLHDAGGDSSAGEFRVNATVASDQTAPAIAQDEDLNFVVAWTSFGQDGDAPSMSNIYARLFERSGSDIVAAAGEFRVNTATTADQQRVAVTRTGTDGFVFVWDGKSAADAKGVDFALHAGVVVNAAPVLAGVNALLCTTEDATADAGTLIASLISGQVSDADAGATAGVAVVAVDDTHGTWQYTTDAGGTWLAFGAASAANARLLAADASSAVRFVPNAHWHGTVAGGLTLRAWDGTSGAAGGTADTTLNGGTSAFSSASASASISVTAVNDAPGGTNKTVATNEDTAYVFTTADFGFADAIDTPPDALLGVRIDSLPSAGSLRLNGVAVSTGQFITAANIAAGQLTYLAAVNASGMAYASFDFQVRDDGGTSAGGVDLDPVPNTITIDVAAVNDAPVNQLPGAQATTLIVPVILSAGGGNGISITDVDAGAGSVEVTLTATDGVISLGGLLGLIFSLGDGLSDGSITYSGSLADVNAALDGLIFVADIGFGGIATLTVTTRDLGNSGLGGAQLDTDVLQIYVNSVATLLITDESEATSEDAMLNAASVLANDIDLLFGSLSVSEVNGTAAAIGSAFVLPSGATLTMQANGTFSYDPRTAFGTLGAGATYTDNFGYTVDTTSLGGSGYGRVSITIGGVNDAPVLSGVHALVDIAEDVTADAGTLVVSLISGQISDADAGATAGVAVVAVDDTHGTWQYTTDAGGTWLAFGAASAANARLLAADASSAVRFVPNAHWHGTVAGGLTLRAWDGTSGTAGGTADTTLNGGTSAFSSASASASITVTAVNDAPSGTNKTVATNEDTAYVFTTADFGFADAIDTPADALLGVRIDSLPSAGSLRLNGVAVSAGQFITAANIAAGQLTYLAAANASGMAYASFDFQVRDDGGTSAGGVDLDTTPNTITIDVVAVNDAPSGAYSSITTFEDTAYVFRAADFGFADAADTPANGLLAVQIATLPAAGALTHDGTAVVAGQVVSVVDIAAGKLVFTPAADANDAAYASFTFRVQDDGGTAGGGIAVDPTPALMSIAVTPVNDAPTLTAFFDAIATGTQDAEVEITFAELAAQADASDLDGSVTAFVVRAVAGGTLRVGTSAATATAWQMGTNDVLDATHTAYWTPAAAAHGTLSAFDLTARDDSGAESSTPITATVAVSTVPATVPSVPAPAPDPIAAPTEPAAQAAPVIAVEPVVGTLSLEVAAATNGHALTAEATSLRSDPLFPAPATQYAARASSPPSVGPSDPPNATQDEVRVLQTVQNEAGNGAQPARTERGGTPPMMLARVPAAELASAPAAQAPTAGAGAAGAERAPDYALLRSALDETREQAPGEQVPEQRVAGAAAVVTGSLSAGYVLWLVRGGVLASSLLSSLPAWRAVDPLPVLARPGRREDDSDDESLESIVEDERDDVDEPSPATDDAARHSKSNPATGRVS